MNEEAKPDPRQGTRKGVVYTILEKPEPKTFVVSPVAMDGHKQAARITVKVANKESLVPSGGPTIETREPEVGNRVCFYVDPQYPDVLCVHLATMMDLISYKNGKYNAAELNRVYVFNRMDVQTSFKTKVFFFDPTTGLGGQAEVRVDKPEEFKKGCYVIFKMQTVEMPEQLKQQYGLEIDENLGEDVVLMKATPLEIVIHRKLIGEQIEEEEGSIPTEILMAPIIPVL